MVSTRYIAWAGFLLHSLAGHAFFTITAPQPSAVEYVNDVTGHYVLLADPAERAAVDAGSAGPSWRPTGYSFRVEAPGTELRDGNVCRFYGPGANSHFHTGVAAECQHLRDNPSGWNFEKFDFSAPLAHGGCEAMLDPVYRLYNNRWMFGDSNHRYTPDPALRAEMIAAGWVDEGIAFCTPSWARAAAKEFTVTAGKLAPTAECEDESLNLGACVALNQLPRMPNRVTSFLPPWWVERNPAYPATADAATGVAGAHELATAHPIGDAAAVAWHSFVQTNGEASLFGIWVNSFDRTRGDLSSINPLYQFATRAPEPGAMEARVFPWGDGRDHDLEVAFELKVATLLRADPASWAYGHPTLQFVDRATGEHLYVTIGAYGPLDEGTDYLARDTATGRVIVGTTFRANPGFGKRMSGEAITCPGQGACLPAATDAFRFRIDRAAFQRVLERARTLAPTLSPSPADYHLANFHFNNEVYRDGAIGLRLANFRLQIFDR